MLGFLEWEICVLKNTYFTFYEKHLCIPKQSLNCLICIVLNFVQMESWSLHSSSMYILKNILFVRVIHDNGNSYGSFIFTAVWNFIVHVY